LKAWPILGIAIVQTILFLAHWFLYCTWIDFGWPLGPSGMLALRVALVVLSLVFVVATVLAFRFNGPIVSFLYKISAVWLGLLNYLFFGACFAWLVDLILRFADPAERMALRPWLASGLLAASVAVFLYGVINARILRVQRVTVALDRLPEAWRGRTALVVSDMHLGNVNAARFAARVAAIAKRLNPDAIFLPGDLFDGTRVEVKVIAAPLFELKPPQGIFFVTGNHEEMGGAEHYIEGLRQGGVRVLRDERVEVDGLQIIGVDYRTSTHPIALRQLLLGFHLSEGPASILLQHVPNRLPIVEQAGVSLMLCGHTHGGQVFPFTWIARRAFGKFTYGLQRFNMLQVLTSSGVGTWGPPMRVGTHAEVVLLTFA
jgi:predicted MPP superfamily phosphohydrolase